MGEDIAPGLVPEIASNKLLLRAEEKEKKEEEEVTFISSEDTSCLNGFLSESSDGCDPTLILEILNSNLAKAMAVVTTGYTSEPAAFFDLLHGGLEKVMENEEVVKAWCEQEDVHAHVFEVLCRVVELTVLLLAKHNSPEHVFTTTDTGYLLDIMETLSLALGRNYYYTLRKEKNMRRNLLVYPNRLKSVLQVPGYFVRVRGAEVIEDSSFYYCSKDGVNQMGRECEKGCRDLHENFENFDAVWVQLSCLMGKNAYGNGYKYILEMLSHPKSCSLEVLQFLLHTIDMLTFVPVEENPLVKEDSTVGRIRCGIQESSFDNVYQCVFQYLKESIDAFDRDDRVDVKRAISTGDSLTSMVQDLHQIGLFGSKTIALDLTGQLQIALWKSLLKKNLNWFVCASIGEAVERTFPSRLAILLPTAFSSWLNEEDVIFKLLNFDYDLVHVPEVVEFVGKISKKGLLQQQHVVRILKPENSATKEHMESHDLIVASVLDWLQPDAISTEVLSQTVDWLEQTKTISQIPGESIIFILNKLAVDKLAACHKDNSLKERFKTIFWKHSGSAPAADLAIGLTKIANCFEPVLEVESLKLDSVLQGKEGKDFLQSCSNADADTKFDNYLTGANSQSTSYAKRAKVWNEKELDFYMCSLPMLEHVLPFDIPFSRYDISSECLKRVDLAEHLIAGLQSPAQSTLAPAMALAISPEIQTLEALETESARFLEIDKRIHDLNEKHFRLFEALKEEQHERLVEFFQECRREKEIVAREALYAKAKVVACTKRAQLDEDFKLSSDAILSRMLQRAEGVIKAMEVQHKTRLEEEMQKMEKMKQLHQKRLDEEKPKFKCAICYLEFGEKIDNHGKLTERACFSPCGHASVCYDCASRAKNLRGRCPFCQARISTICIVPSKLYF